VEKAETKEGFEKEEKNDILMTFMKILRHL